MRILLLSTGGKIGGEETFTRNLALGLIERGHYVEMAVGGPVQREDAEKAGLESPKRHNRPITQAHRMRRPAISTLCNKEPIRHNTCPSRRPCNYGYYR